MSIWYNRSGVPIVTADFKKDLAGWRLQIDAVEKLLKDRNYKIIAQEDTPKKRYWISTVWLGLDHDYSPKHGTGPNPHPLIFETMVFRVKRGKVDYSGIDLMRYETEAQAAKGHAKMVRHYTDIEADEET